MGDSALAIVAPYGFADGLARLGHILDAPPERAVARLAVARALVDATLFGEMTQDAVMLGELAARDHWDLAEYLLSDPSDHPQVAMAQSQGLALVAALRHRGMDRGYHQVLANCAEGGIWEVEARLGRLLDLEEAMVVSSEVPAEDRAQILADALGGRLPPCVAAAPLYGVEGSRRDTVLIGHCGHEALGWPVAAEERLFHPTLGRLSVVMARGSSDLRRVLARTGHPLVAEGRGEIEAFGGRIARRGIAVPLQVEAADDFPFVLPIGVGDSLGVGPFVMLDKEGVLRVGVSPIVSIGAAGARFVENDAGFAFPGQPSAHAALDERLARAGDLFGPHSSLVIFLPGAVRVRSVALAIRAVRAALPLRQRGELVVGVFQPGVGLRGVRFQLATGREPSEVVLPVAPEGPLDWPASAEDSIVVVPDQASTVQRLLDVLGRVRERVGTALVLL
jgi:hypothetical protein